MGIAGLSILRSASSFQTNLTGIFSADSSTGTTTGRSILPSASSALSLKNNLTAILGIDDDHELSSVNVSVYEDDDDENDGESDDDDDDYYDAIDTVVSYSAFVTDEMEKTKSKTKTKPAATTKTTTKAATTTRTTA